YRGVHGVDEPLRLLGARQRRRDVTGDAQQQLELAFRCHCFDPLRVAQRPSLSRRQLAAPSPSFTGPRAPARRLLLVSMTSEANAIDAQQTLAGLATRYHGAARVFQRHGLDFCCRGQVTLEQACRDRWLDVGTVVAELHHELRTPADDERWDERPVPELIDH